MPASAAAVKVGVTSAASDKLLDDGLPGVGGTRSARMLVITGSTTRNAVRGGRGDGFHDGAVASAPVLAASEGCRPGQRTLLEDELRRRLDRRGIFCTVSSVDGRRSSELVEGFEIAWIPACWSAGEINATDRGSGCATIWRVGFAAGR
jgi:hypothetical protein